MSRYFDTDEYKNITKQSIVALLFDILGFISGLILILYNRIFMSVFWVSILYPGILGVRGALNGILCGRMSTGLHLGTIKPSLFKNTDLFYSVIGSLLTLSYIEGLLIGTYNYILIFSLYRTGIGVFMDIISVVTFTMFTGPLIIIPITTEVSNLSYKHGMDPDILVYPIMSTVADILVTLIFFLTIDLYLLNRGIIAVINAFYFIR